MNHSLSQLSRRDFIGQAALAASLLALGARAAGGTDATPPRFPLIGFSKPFQKFNPAQTADFTAEVGWDGIECPVRAKGQIEPERAADELPRFGEAMRTRGKQIYIATTDITAVSQPHAETVLRAASRLGIKRIRLGFWRYDLRKSPADRLREIAPALKDIADACGELGLQAGFQNHSGRDFVGAPIWDVFTIIRDLDPKHIGMCFDIGHATIEGGLSWPIEAKLMAPFYTAIFVKDFVWQKGGKGWEAAWCNLGAGMVNKAFFVQLKASDYRGPICQHHEYPLGDAKQMLTHLRNDLQVLKTWLA